MKIIRKMLLGLMVVCLILVSMATPTLSAPPVAVPRAVKNASEVTSPIKNEQDLINHLLSDGNIAQIALTAANKQNSLKNNSEARCDIKLTATVLPYITRSVLDYSADSVNPVEILQEEALSNDTMTFEKTLASKADSYKATFNKATINDLFAEAQSGIFVHYNKYSLDFDKGEKMVYVLVLNIQTGYYQELPNNKTIDFGCYENFALYLGVANIHSQNPFDTPTQKPSITRPPVTPPLPTKVQPTKAPPTNPPAPEPIPEIYIRADVDPFVSVLGTVGNHFSYTITYDLDGSSISANPSNYKFIESIGIDDMPMEGLPPEIAIIQVNRVSDVQVEVVIDGVPTTAGDYTIMLPTGILAEKALLDGDDSNNIIGWESIVPRVFYPRTLTFPVSIAKGNGAVVDISTVSNTSDSITVEATLSSNLGSQNIEYAITDVNVAPDEYWQSNPEFGGLYADTTYYVWARAADNMNCYEGIAKSVEVKTAALSTEETPSPIPAPEYELMLSAIIASCMNITDSPTTYQMISNNPFTAPEDFRSNYTLKNSGLIPGNSEQVTVSGGNLATYDAFPTIYESATEMTNIWWQKTLLKDKPSSSGDWDTNILSKYMALNERSLLENIVDMVKATGSDPMNPQPTVSGPPETTQPPTGSVSPPPTPSTPPTEDGGGGVVEAKPTPTPTVTLTDPTRAPALPNASNPLSSGGDTLRALENPALNASTLGGSLVSAANQMFDPTQLGNSFLGGVSTGFNLGNILVFAGIAAGVFAILAAFIVRRFAPKGDNAFVK